MAEIPEQHVHRADDVRGANTRVGSVARRRCPVAELTSTPEPPEGVRALTLADLIREAVTAAGFASQEAVHASLTRKLERVVEQAQRGLKTLADNPDPDLTILVEQIGGIVREAQTSAVVLDMLATLARNLEAEALAVELVPRPEVDRVVAEAKASARVVPMGEHLKEPSGYCRTCGHDHAEPEWARIHDQLAKEAEEARQQVAEQVLEALAEEGRGSGD